MEHMGALETDTMHLPWPQMAAGAVWQGDQATRRRGDLSISSGEAHKSLRGEAKRNVASAASGMAIEAEASV